MLRPALRTHEQAHAATAAEAPIDVAAVQWRVRIMITIGGRCRNGCSSAVLGPSFDTASILSHPDDVHVLKTPQCGYCLPLR